MPRSPYDLLDVLKSHAYKTGKFKLTSGQESDEYLDVKNALLHPDAPTVASHVTAAIGVGNCDAVAGLEAGGALLAKQVAGLRLRPALWVRKDERDHGTTVNGIDGLSNLPPHDGTEATRSNVWLVEDVITTGQSVITALERLTRMPALRVVGVVGVVDREQGGLERIRAAYPGLIVTALTTLSAVRARE